MRLQGLRRTMAKDVLSRKSRSLGLTLRQVFDAAQKRH
jgi:hypothetical protein